MTRDKTAAVLVAEVKEVRNPFEPGQALERESVILQSKMNLRISLANEYGIPNSWWDQIAFISFVPQRDEAINKNTTSFIVFRRHNFHICIHGWIRFPTLRSSFSRHWRLKRKLQEMKRAQGRSFKMLRRHKKLASLEKIKKPHG